MRNAPHYPDPLLGRAEDIARVRALLDDPACRLLTLVGPGGIGKTRLALAATDGNVARYAHGACFIPFAGLTPAQAENSTDLVINSIANALGYTFDAQQDPHTILLNYLANKRLLLICDNFEHLQPAATLLEEIVLAAPGVQLVVTSRKRLGVKHEWLYDVAGLAYATAGESWTLPRAPIRPQRSSHAVRNRSKWTSIRLQRLATSTRFAGCSKGGR